QTLERALTPSPSPENRRERGASYPVPGSSSPSPGGFREEFSARLASSYVRGRAEWGLGGEGLLLLARALEAASEDQGALVDYRRAVEANPGSEEARLRLGRLLARLGQTAEGRRELEEAHRLAPGDPEPCLALGMSFWPDVAAHPDRA